jgi:D-xylose transport system permease protein
VTTNLQAAPADDVLAPPSPSVGDAMRDWWARIRGGDVGSLPAVLGLLVLLAIFSVLRPSTFTNAYNFANLLVQSAGVIAISMGLVYVLLIGEIDLGAGYVAGVSGAMMGVTTTQHGWPWWAGILVALITGGVIGLVVGLLVSRIGIPSFVVTLATFLALQGILLAIIGEGGSIAIQNTQILAIMASNLPIWMGWALYILVIAGYGIVTYRQMAVRRARNLVTQPPTVWLIKLIGLAVLLGLCTYYLSIERSRNPSLTSIKGVPIVIPVLLVLLLILTFILNRTVFGRHVYAVGGNAEAARRAGINVPRLRLLCFVISSTVAGLAGVLLSSQVGSVTPATGGGATLLYAVGAAVIGGTSLFGGKGRPMDAILGGLVVAAVANGMGLLNQSAAVVYMITGLVLLLAAGVDALSRRRAAASGRG